MALRETIIHIDGMTCASCERRVEKALAGVQGVASANTSQARGRALVAHEENAALPGLLRAAIEKAGYAVRESPSRATAISLGIGLAIAAVYLVASSAGAFNAFPAIDRSVGYGMLVVIGLLTSVHCVAMCGGLVLSQSLGPQAATSAAGAGSGSFFARLLPGLLYNGGRVLSYTIVGAIVGGLGSALGFSPEAMGSITALAGLFMLALGLKMIGLVPELPRLSRFLPAPFRKAGDRMAKALAGRGPFAVGILGGLMPCGPLQTMQLYALGTGSALAGAFSMFLFAIGTVPLLLAFGATAALLPRKFMPIMIRASAVLVLLLGALTIGRAAALAGISIPDPFAGQSQTSGYSVPRNPAEISSALAIPVVAAGSGDASTLVASNTPAPVTASIKDGVQTLVTVFGSNNYAPFVVQAGIPLRWTVRIKKEDLNGCNRTLIVPAYKIRKDLRPGDNLIEFTPTSAGIVPYSCWMGMIRSAFKVVPDLGAGNSSLPGEFAPPASGAAGTASVETTGASGAQAASGSCCGSATANAAFAGGRVPVDTIGMPTIRKGVQEIVVTVDGSGYIPAALVLQRGMKAVIKLKAAALDCCNYLVYFPDYNGGLDLSKGELATPEIPVTGDFSFQCGMGMIHGYVKVVDDISRVDVKAVKEEIGKWQASTASGGCCGG